MIKKKSRLLALGVALLAAVIILMGAGQVLAAPAKHVILIIGDGMHNAHEMAGSRYLFGQDQALSFHKLDHHYYAATWDVTAYNLFGADPQLFKTPGVYSPKDFKPEYGYSAKLGGQAPWPMQADSQFSREVYFLKNRYGGKKPAATDSASAATALFTGVKTDDGNISWRPGDPPGGSLETIGEKFRRQLGASLGAVSTVPFNHATPAALCAHNVFRNNYSPNNEDKGFHGLTIAEEIIQKTRPEVVIGSGHPGWNPKFITPELLAKLKADGEYVLVERVKGKDGEQSLAQAAAQAAKQGKKLFGLYGGPGGDFENRRPSDIPGKPMVDRGSPENPTLAGLVKAALTVLAKNPKGFFLMAEQGNLDWRSHGNDYAGMVGCVADLHEGVQAVIDFINQEGDDLTWDNTLLIVTADHANSFMRLTKKLGAGDLPRQVAMGKDKYGPVFATAAYPDGEVTYGTKSHTNELVNVYAKGAGSELFQKFAGTWYPGKIIDNTHIYEVMAQAGGVK